ncbi:MAG: ATP-binding cassette domain-containing protein [Xanthomonadales bacterium]|nr:ATP-binding cassette domain-containing protein [Xanthomonadales bacterium]
MSAPLLVLSGLRKRFGATVAVDGVELEIGAGEFFALLGGSGCGKSTLLRLIAGLERPDEGRVWLDGRDITELPPHRRPLHTMFQSYALFPHLSVADNIAFGLRRQGWSRPAIAARVAEMLRLVQLEGLGGRRPHQLSGGQQQRVALARALAPRPRLVLLDEPLSALDRRLREAMRAELKAIQREVGITFVAVTHDQEEAMGLATRMAVMERGRLLQVDSPRAIYERPANRFVASFIGQVNLLAWRAPGRGRRLALPLPGAGDGVRGRGGAARRPGSARAPPREAEAAPAGRGRRGKPACARGSPGSSTAARARCSGWARAVWSSSPSTRTASGEADPAHRRGGRARLRARRRGAPP